MRTALRDLDGQRFTITATVKRYGGKLTNIEKLSVYSWQETILLVDVRHAESGKLLTDHVWFKVGKTFERLNAKTGDTIQFDARVDEYHKKAGIDYHLERPTKMKITESNPHLFPEEVARTVGTGIIYAKQLKEQYEKQRKIELFDDYKNWDDDEEHFEHRSIKDRSYKIQKIREAHQKGLIQIEERLLLKGGFKKITDEQVDEMISLVLQVS